VERKTGLRYSPPVAEAVGLWDERFWGMATIRYKVGRLVYNTLPRSANQRYATFTSVSISSQESSR
jgi:hypothetical protein